MPVLRMTLNFEYLTLFSSVQICTHNGHMLTALTKLYVLNLHVNSFFLLPISMFSKCVCSVVYISQICFYIQHVPAMVSPTLHNHWWNDLSNKCDIHLGAELCSLTENKFFIFLLGHHTQTVLTVS